MGKVLLPFRFLRYRNPLIHPIKSSSLFIYQSGENLKKDRRGGRGFVLLITGHDMEPLETGKILLFLFPASQLINDDR